MMYIVEIPVTFPKGQTGHVSMGSVFHGALMELVGTEAAARFHEESLRPYRQCLLPKPGNQAVWQFGILTEGAFHTIMEALQRQQSIYLRQKRWTIAIGEPRVLWQAAEKDLMEKHLDGAIPTGGQITYLTPVGFKQQGQYVLLPDSRLVLQSALARWNAFAAEPLEEGIADVLGYYTQLRRYRIQSQVFGVEKQYIPGCVGTMSFAFLGDEMVRRTTALLWDFACVSGLGIKTALGMGTVITKIHYKE